MQSPFHHFNDAYGMVSVLLVQPVGHLSSLWLLFYGLARNFVSGCQETLVVVVDLVCFEIILCPSALS